MARTHPLRDSGNCGPTLDLLSRALNKGRREIPIQIHVAGRPDAVAGHFCM